MAGNVILSHALVNANYILSEVLMNLTKAELGKEYIVRTIKTDDEELNSFLFSLGCYSGEPITVVSCKRNLFGRIASYVVSIKDARYTIDHQLAAAIEL